MDLAASPPRLARLLDPSRADLPRPEPLPAVADEALVLRRAARAAEDVGNFGGARRLVQLLPADVEQGRWLRSLDEVLRLGPAPAVGPLALWLLQPALRFGLGSVRAAAVRLLTQQVLRARGGGAGPGAEGSPPGSLPGALLDDPLLADAALFDAGLLEAYVESALDPSVLARTALLADWPAAAVSVFELTERDGNLLGRDLLDDREVRLLSASPLPPDTAALVYGRPVPWPAEPGARFVLPPLPLDRNTARRVLRAISRRAPVEERLRAVAAHQRRTGTAPSLDSSGR